MIPNVKAETEARQEQEQEHQDLVDLGIKSQSQSQSQSTKPCELWPKSQADQGLKGSQSLVGFDTKTGLV
ncbi:hypothetical protein [Pseudomonas frederiksbergensis]|uniref:hypothetical protein n=1 Tax=Pseudomonas frederiksbergensis TaxID=104087 RepID=UPI001F1907AA|nr:hypothetical protein [Pseudomonas frederiksbergensis]